MYASRTRKEEFSGHDENCQQNASDLEGSLVTSSRPPGRPQKRPESPDDRASNGGVATQAADGSRRTVGAADERCRRCRRSSLSCTVEPCAADIGGLLHTACIAPAQERQASAVDCSY